MGNTMRLLSEPDTDTDVESGTGETFIYTVVSMQGWRRYQEDKYVCIPDFHEDSSFFGVFDGHGGSEIAQFLERRLHYEILNFLEAEDDIELALHSGFLSCDASLREPEIIAELNDLIEEENRGALQILRNRESLDADMPEEEEEHEEEKHEEEDQSNIAGPSGKHIENYSEKMQVERLQYLLSGDFDSSDPGDEDYNMEEDEDESEEDSDEDPDISTEDFLGQEPGFLSGSTATVAIIQQKKIFVANVGDSRCVLSRGGRAIDLSLDHKPEDPEERARIISAGGSISDDGRVNSCLNLSRAFGDFKFKGNSSEPPEQCITAEPFIRVIDIEKEDNFLIIASDGIWNSMSSQEVVDFIEERLQDKNSNLEDVCTDIFRLTLATDTDNDGTGCDNMTCIIIKFNK